MSGDNYRDCPLCRHLATVKRDAALAAFMETCGGQAPDILVERPIDEDELGCIREYYELGIDDKGNFQMYFGARCDKCQTEFDFKVEPQKTGFSIDV